MRKTRVDRPSQHRTCVGSEGFSVWDWLVIAVGAVFIVQALVRLNASRSVRS